MDQGRRRIVRAASALPVLAALPPAHAQRADVSKVIIGFPPGSTVDVFARLVAERMSAAGAGNVIVENRVGGGGVIAVGQAKQEKPDSGVILMTPMPVLSVYPFTYAKLAYNAQADFTPLSRGVVYDRAFAVGSQVPASVRTIADYCNWAKGDPLRASFGSPAAGSPLHFTGIVIGKALGVELQHVPYRGTVTALPDLAEGRLPAYVGPLGDLYKFHTQGRLRILGTSGTVRSPFSPDIPTFGEQGLTGLGPQEGYVFFGPAGMAPELVARINDALRRAISQPEVKTALVPVCMTPSPSTPEELAEDLKGSMAFWGPVVKSIGFKADA